MSQVTIGHAKIVKRWTPTFPSRKEKYFDATEFGGGYVQMRNLMSGAAVLHDDVLMDLRTGRVYTDSRFALTKVCPDCDKGEHAEGDHIVMCMRCGGQGMIREGG